MAPCITVLVCLWQKLWFLLHRGTTNIHSITISPEKNILNNWGANALLHSCHHLIKHQLLSHESQLCVKGKVRLHLHPYFYFPWLFAKATNFICLMKNTNYCKCSAFKVRMVSTLWRALVYKQNIPLSYKTLAPDLQSKYRSYYPSLRRKMPSSQGMHVCEM